MLPPLHVPSIPHPTTRAAADLTLWRKHEPNPFQGLGLSTPEAAWIQRLDGNEMKEKGAECSL